MRTSGFVDTSGTVRCDRCGHFMGLAKGSPIMADDLAYEGDSCADCHRPLSMLVRVPYLASRAAWHVKTAHGLAALTVLGSLAFGTAQAACISAGSDSWNCSVDPFPVAAVAEEIENHSYSVGLRGHAPGCVALVSSRDDGTFFVTLETTEGKPLTFPHGPYPSEQVGMIDVLGAFGRGC